MTWSWQRERESESGAVEKVGSLKTHQGPGVQVLGLEVLSEGLMAHWLF